MAEQKSLPVVPFDFGQWTFTLTNNKEIQMYYLYKEGKYTNYSAAVDDNTNQQLPKQGIMHSFWSGPRKPGLARLFAVRFCLFVSLFACRKHELVSIKQWKRLSVVFCVVEERSSL